jgi:hypothetical protein
VSKVSVQREQLLLRPRIKTKNFLAERSVLKLLNTEAFGYPHWSQVCFVEDKNEELMSPGLSP